MVSSRAEFKERLMLYKEPGDRYLRVRVYDEDIAKTDDFLGEGSVDLDEPNLFHTADDLHSLETTEPRKYELFSKKGGTGKHAGFVFLGFSHADDHHLDSEGEGERSGSELRASRSKCRKAGHLT
jgi:hypothetical protein